MWLFFSPPYSVQAYSLLICKHKIEIAQAWFFRKVHPFLLADNRHYVFYLWRRTLGYSKIIKYVIAPPVCVIATVLMLLSMKRQHYLSNLTFWIITSMTLIPSSLIEFRYFIIPFIFWHFRARSNMNSIISEAAIYYIINITTVYIYLYKPFVWHHEPDAIQRFIWWKPANMPSNLNHDYFRRKQFIT